MCIIYKYMYKYIYDSFDNIYVQEEPGLCHSFVGSQKFYICSRITILKGETVILVIYWLLILLYLNQYFRQFLCLLSIIPIEMNLS